MYRLGVSLLLLVALALPASAALPHLEPGTLVAGGEPNEGVLVLLYVQSGFKESQAVYMVRPVARCSDPSGPGWYAPVSTHELRSAPELEGRQRLGTLDPNTLPTTCANPVPAPLSPSHATVWDQLADGTLDPFGPVTFPVFGTASVTLSAESGPSGGGGNLLEASYRPPAAGA